MKMVMFGGIKYSLKASGNNNYYDTNTLVSVAKMYSQIFRTSKGNLWIKRATCTVMYFCVIAGCYSFEETCPSQSSKYFMVLADQHSYRDVESRAPLIRPQKFGQYSTIFFQIKNKSQPKYVFSFEYGRFGDLYVGLGDLICIMKTPGQSGRVGMDVVRQLYWIVVRGTAVCFDPQQTTTSLLTNKSCAMMLAVHLKET